MFSHDFTTTNNSLNDSIKYPKLSFETPHSICDSKGEGLKLINLPVLQFGDLNSEEIIKSLSHFIIFRSKSKCYFILKQSEVIHSKLLN